MWKVIIALGLGLMVCACKQSAPAPTPTEPTPARAEQVEPAQPEPRPVRDPFELEDEIEDPAAALEAARHDCCEEMPAREQRQHTGKAQPGAAAR